MYVMEGGLPGAGASVDLRGGGGLPGLEQVCMCGGSGDCQGLQ